MAWARGHTAGVPGASPVRLNGVAPRPHRIRQHLPVAGAVRQACRLLSTANLLLLLPPFAFPLLPSLLLCSHCSCSVAACSSLCSGCGRRLRRWPRLPPRKGTQQQQTGQLGGKVGTRSVERKRQAGVKSR